MIFKNWITNHTAAPFYARKQFVISKEIRSAEAKVCGLGQFHFYVNGKKAGDHELDPGWTDYRKWIQYVTFDIKDLLVRGENVLGAEVGNGWYIKKDEYYTFRFPDFMGENPNPYRPFGKHLILALKLEIVYTDGTVQVIEADDTFSVKEHPVVMSNVYGSEIIDNRKKQKGWCGNGFCGDGWEPAGIADPETVPAGVLCEQFQPAVKVIRTYEGKLLHTVEKKSREKNGEETAVRRDIYDFGQNMSGILELELCGKAGDTVKLYPAEKLSERGDVDQEAKNWVEVDSCIVCILGGDSEWERFRMKFTYFAGKYIAVERIPADGGDPAGIRVRNIRAHALTSAWKRDGDFVCDDERYHKIYDLIEKTVEANMISVHTDCPTIERFAWQEPNHLMAPSVFYMKDGSRLWEKFLTDMRMQQHTAEDFFYDREGKRFYPGEGLMPSQCPCYIPNVLPVPGMGSFYDIIPWGSTCILGTYWHYLFYGSRKIIEENYEAGLRYLHYLQTKVTEEGFINHGLGDWGNPRHELARENVETVFLYADASVLAEFAGILGKEKDRVELTEYAEKVKANYNKMLLRQHPTKGYWCYRVWESSEEFRMTQACEALPLFWGMVPAEKETDVVKAFGDTLEEAGAFVSGEVGLPYIIQTARKYNMNDRIAKFITREEHPSYYAFVRDGMTTLGEYWETNPRSHCHDMMGHIIEWYYNGIAGIIPEAPGFKKVTIRPYLPEGMHEFRCSYDSVKGTIRVHVREEQDDRILEVQVPEGIEYKLDPSNLETGGKKVYCNR